MAPTSSFALPANRSLIPRPAGPFHAHSQSGSSDGGSTSTGSSKISGLAAKLVSGVNPVSPEEAHRRWHPPATPNNEPRVSSNYRPRQGQAPLSPTSRGGDSKGARITASAFAAAKEERQRAASRGSQTASPHKSPLPSASRSASPSKPNKYSSPNPNVAASRPFAPRAEAPSAAAAKHRPTSYLAKSNIHSTDGGGGIDENRARRGEGENEVGLGRPSSVAAPQRYPTPGAAMVAAVSRNTPSPPGRRTSHTYLLGKDSPYAKRASPGGPERTAAKTSATPALVGAVSPNPSFDLSYYTKAGFPTPTLESLVAAANANESRRGSWALDAHRALGLADSDDDVPIRRAGSSSPAAPQTVPVASANGATERPRSILLGAPFSRTEACHSRDSLLPTPTVTPAAHTPRPQEPYRRPASCSPAPSKPSPTPSRPLSLAPSTIETTPRSSMSTDHASAIVLRAHKESFPPVSAPRLQTPEPRAATPNGSPRKGAYSALQNLVSKASSAALRGDRDAVDSPIEQGNGIDKAAISGPKSPRKARSRAQSMISVFTRGCGSSNDDDEDEGPPKLERREKKDSDARERYLARPNGETEKQRVDREFEMLMQGMQIPDAVRRKMATLDHPVKAAMLKSSFSATLSSHSFLAAALQLSDSPSMDATGATLSNPARRTKRSKSGSDLRGLNILGLGRARTSPPTSAVEGAAEDWFMVDASPALERPSRRVTHAKSFSIASASPAAVGEEHGPAWWALRLKSQTYGDLVAGEVKKLRVSLRTQAPSWTAEFVVYGGYGAMLRRLKELLEVEWREEQHDDQVLFELLRCLKALLLTEPGKAALTSTSPTPFVQLVELLYSEKKPGELSCRQLLVELVHGLFDLYPPSFVGLVDESGIPKAAWGKGIDLSTASHAKASGGPVASSAPLLPPVSGRFESALSPPTNRSNVSLPPTPTGGDGLKPSAHALVKSLLVGPPDAKAETTVDFMNDVRRPRLFKKLVVELSGVLMDYFWIFCHSDNKFWDLKKLDEPKIEAPQVPSGMTGGVEYEAMLYCTTVMRLINEVARTSPSPADARQLHSDLYLSGLERCLLTLRKCSEKYYPSVHLELARYLSHARSCGFDVPVNTLRHLAGLSPDEYLLKSPVRSAVARIEQRSSQQFR